MLRIHGDFETRSAIDLTKTTTAVYASHPSTDIVSFAYSYNDEEPRLWVPGEQEPYDLMNAVNRGDTFVAHNISFEYEIWNEVLHKRYDWPPLLFSQCSCTMARSYAMSLPGKLERAAAAVGLKMQKDMRGHRIMLKFCKPRKIIENGCTHCDGSGVQDGNIYEPCEHCYGTGNGYTWWHEDPDYVDQLLEIYEYNKQDVRVEQELDKRLLELSDKEQKVFYLDHVVNKRGIHIDVDNVLKAKNLASNIKAELDTEMHRQTQGYVSATSNVNQLTDYVRFHGIETPGIAKADIALILEDPKVNEHIKGILHLRQQASKTSTAKLDKMLSSVNEENRINYTIQYHGAGTGRFAGRIIQPHNMPRPAFKHHQIEAGIEHLDDPELLKVLFGDPMTFISHSLRAMITAGPGNTFYCGDFSAIESRKLAWLSDQQDKLDIFRGDGKVYEYNAGIIYNMDPADVKDGSNERQVGKVSELALGYQGGIGAFLQMAKTYGIDPEPLYADLWAAADNERRERAEWGFKNWKSNNPTADVSEEGGIAIELIKLGWRAAAPNTVRYWQTLEDAAILALENPGKTYAARKIRFKKSGSFLFCRLPSGRLICYPYAKVGEMLTPWDEVKKGMIYKSVNGKTNKWERTTTYGGKLAENVTQASSRCLLTDSMIRVEEREYPVVFHVHDEVVSEVPEGTGDLDEFIDILSEVPEWAEGLPMAASGWTGKRYRK